MQNWGCRKTAGWMMAVLCLCVFGTLARGNEISTAGAGSIAHRTATMRHLDGFFPIDWDETAGKLYLEIPQMNQEFLLLDQLPYGMGSNDIGLDRGQLGSERVVHFEHVGGKVLLVQTNLRFRSSAADPDEQLAVAQSFAQSVLWGFRVEAEDGHRVLVDATDFFLRDAHNVAERIASAHQGIYREEISRSAIAMDATKDFPKNTEVEAVETFVSQSEPKGKYLEQVTPDAHAVTVREHTSLIALPNDGYQPRVYDPRSGYFPLRFRDEAAGVNERLDKRYIERHWLQKKDPAAAVSDPVEPIVYYVDRGAPEPIRSALVEGASWWNQAFEAAGFHNAFQVKVLPEGADPMDIRYNMIQWVHRATRGWSYGASVIDPRTGEILKGQVTLGSLRARQDYRIAEALLAPYLDGKPIPRQMEAMVLARTRQLAAHEVGHTLGLAHNFAASSQGQGESVMDYPHPWITLDATGKPTLDHAYATGIGAWDKDTIRYGYTQFAPGVDEQAALQQMLHQEAADGVRYITDEDARPLGGAHPYAHLWDNGADAPTELERLLTVRAAALKRFGPDTIRIGEPVAEMEVTLVPLYLLHRYQTEATAKLIGGLDYRYAVRGDGGMVTEMIPAAKQRQALAAVLKTLDASTLTLPDSLLQLLPPVPPGYPRTRESFGGFTGVTFDPEGAVEAAAGLTVSLLFDPARASRLVEYHARDASLPGLEEVIRQTLAATWDAPRQPGLVGLTQNTVDDLVLRGLLGLAANAKASPEARAEALEQAIQLKHSLLDRQLTATEAIAHRDAAVRQIEDFQRNPAKYAPAPILPTPPGQPIGDAADDETTSD